jgi:hypothetical protein
MCSSYPMARVSRRYFLGLPARFASDTTESPLLKRQEPCPALAGWEREFRLI